MPKDAIREAYGDRLRVRVGGILFDNFDDPRALLLVEHDGLYDEDPFWTMPGGEVQFGESLTEALRREFAEETGLDISIDRLLYTLDFVRPPLHAVSFYFLCHLVNGTLRSGSDPELDAVGQFIRHVSYVPLDRIPGLRVYPENFAKTVIEDAKSGFDAHPQHLGTRR